jgi:hypothetical protein
MQIDASGEQPTFALQWTVVRHQHSENTLSSLPLPPDFHPRILYLTGTQDQLAKVTKGYRVYFSKVRAFD